ncbi:uncharacterized protein LOC128391897 [Panonychus citri]|uniref:uncharacterized protein LOC128391897 n=1 Tax=Panonychus citri TaxID=50023 RepID=UPI0023074F72|nr:uncharacterized protein LOC128391897 [Panonychus citri]
MDEESYYRFSIPAMELEGNSEYVGVDDEEESLSQSISLPSLTVSLQEQLVNPEIVSSSTKNQVMSMKEIDEKLNALRRENFDLKLRLYCSSQNKGFPRFGDKYFNSCSTQVDGDCKSIKSLIRLSQGSQTMVKLTADVAVQTNPIESEDKIISTDPLIVSSVSMQTELQSSSDASVSCTDLMTNSNSDHLNQFKSIQLRLNEQLNQKTNHSPRPQQQQQLQPKPIVTTTTTLSESHSSRDLINGPSSIPRIKSSVNLPIGGNSDCDFSLIINQSPSILKELSFNSDKTITPTTKSKQLVNDFGISECEYLAGEINSRISMLSNLASLSKSKNRISIIHSQRNRLTNCDESDSISINHDPLEKNPKQFDNRSTGKIYDIINRQISGPISSDKKRDPMVKLNCHENNVDINQNLITYKPTSKRLTRMFDDSENHHFASPDLGIGDSDQDLNSDLKAYIPLGYYQLLRCNLHQLSSHLNYLDNLYRDCFLLQSISLSEYSSEMKPSLTHLNQTINSSRNICKNFTIEDENSIALRLEKIKAKKESMEKAITRQLRKTDKLLRKAKANLRPN